MRYVKQTDRFRCGPVAIVNAIKWSGGTATRKSLPTIDEQCHCKAPGGTMPTNLAKAIAKYGDLFTAKRYFNPPKEKLDKHLDHGGAAILRYMIGKPEYHGHYIFIAGKEGERYLICNDNMRTKNLLSFQKVTNKVFLKAVWKNYKKDSKVVWLLSKN
jgi:hypothetical protein